MNGNKSELRKHLRKVRRGLTQEQQASAALNLLTQLKTIEAFQGAQKIAMYLANDGEIDPVEVMKWAWTHGKCCYVPIVVQEQSNSLLFAEVTDQTKYVNNRYNIPEPVVDKALMITAAQLDLVLLPLVGFDDQGSRIGMGGGFYDTTFEFVRTEKTRAPTLIGIAHEVQHVSRIDAERWDIPLSTVVTDQRAYRTNVVPIHS